MSKGHSMAMGLKKKRKRKKMEEVPTLQQVGFFSYLGYLCLRVIQWPWGLTLTAEPVQDSLEQTVVHL